MTRRPETLAIPYSKWSGAGNTFVFVERRGLPRELEETGRVAQLAGAICRGRGGPGADGLFWIDGQCARVYNADGSAAAFCGNGARCLIAFLLARGRGERASARVGETGIEGWREGDEIAIRVPAPRFRERELELTMLGPFPATWAGRLRRAAWIEAGVPHLCLQFHDAAAGVAPALPPAEELVGVGRRLRGAARFLPGGTNVDFLWTGRESGSAHLRTYERGVEGLTRACGSGALAAAALLLEGQESGAVSLEVASGARLWVAKKQPAWILRGPAEPLARGVFHWETKEAASWPPGSRG